MTDSPKLGPGEVLAGKYLIESEIARGGGGVIYAAHQLGIERALVIKTLLPHYFDDEVAFKRFEREARVASQLQHPNAVMVFDYGYVGDTAYIAMERLKGRTLKEIIQTFGAISAARTQRIIIQVLEVIAAAHVMGVIHRDLKPSNVFLCKYHGKSDFVKVIDFGIAKVIDSAEGRGELTLTETGGVIGSPGYIAPEVLGGGTAGASADLYAIGVIAHELLTGKPAFTGGSTLEKLTQQALGQLQPAPARVLQTPLYQFVLKLLEPEPEDRWESADVALAALHELPLGDVSGTFSTLMTGERPKLRESRSGQLYTNPDSQPPQVASTTAAAEPDPPPEAFFEYASQMLNDAETKRPVEEPGPSVVGLIVAVLVVVIFSGLGVAAWVTGFFNAPAAVVADAGDVVEEDAKPDGDEVRIRITSKPSVADVLVAGKLVGKTPLDLVRPRDPKGEIKVKVSKASYKSKSLTIGLDKDDSIQVKLVIGKKRGKPRRARPKPAKKPAPEPATPPKKKKPALRLGP